MQVIFYISLSFTGVSEKIKSKILVTCKILDFPFFAFAPNLEAVLNCLFEGLRVKNFSFDRFFQGR